MNKDGNNNFMSLVGGFRLQRGLMFGVLIIAALLAFEIFNYSTTDYALGDLLGDLRFAGVHWSTILAIAFCGIDFAGIARLFTPQEGADEPTELWYLFGAWMLAATMNAMLTWWGVSLAIVNHQTLGSAIIERATLLRIVPIFVAVMVWVIRVLIIGTFSVAGDRIFSVSNTRTQSSRFAPARTASSGTRLSRPISSGISRPSTQTSNSLAASSYKPSSKPNVPAEPTYSRPEPTYHPATMSGQSGNGNSQNRRQL